MARAKKQTAKQIEAAKQEAAKAKAAKKAPAKQVVEAEVVKKGRAPLPTPTFDPKKHYDIDRLKEVNRLLRAGKNQKDITLTQQARAILADLGMRFAEYIVVAPHLGLFRKKVDGKVVSVAERKYESVAEESKVLFKKATKVVEAEVAPKKAAKAPKKGRSATLATVTA